MARREIIQLGINQLFNVVIQQNGFDLTMLSCDVSVMLCVWKSGAVDWVINIVCSWLIHYWGKHVLYWYRDAYSSTRMIRFSQSGLLLWSLYHYNDVIMSAMASQITCFTIVYPSVYSGADQRKHQSSTSLALVREIHRWPVNSPHKWPVTRKMLPFDDVIMIQVLSHPSKVTENHASISPTSFYDHNSNSMEISFYHISIPIYKLRMPWQHSCCVLCENF